jgi:protein-S-isoprenylcysteine O-methyltransferase Ste14
MLLLRALLAVAVLPAVVAGVLPWIIAARDPWRVEGSDLGAIVLIAGLAVLLLCVRDFLVVGRGTLAPWDAPRRLVVVGLYRFVRNPMYVGVLLIVCGAAIIAGSPAVAAYGAIVAVVFHLRVVLYEEPVLARLFPDDWPAYAAKVSRWLPRLPTRS